MQLGRGFGVKSWPDLAQENTDLYCSGCSLHKLNHCKKRFLSIRPFKLLLWQVSWIIWIWILIPSIIIRIFINWPKNPEYVLGSCSTPRNGGDCRPWSDVDGGIAIGAFWYIVFLWEWGLFVTGRWFQHLKRVTYPYSVYYFRCPERWDPDSRRGFPKTHGLHHFLCYPQEAFSLLCTRWGPRILSSCGIPLILVIFSINPS